MNILLDASFTWCFDIGAESRYKSCKSIFTQLLWKWHLFEYKTSCWYDGVIFINRGAFLRTYNSQYMYQKSLKNINNWKCLIICNGTVTGYLIIVEFSNDIFKTIIKCELLRGSKYGQYIVSVEWCARYISRDI